MIIILSLVAYLIAGLGTLVIVVRLAEVGTFDEDVYPVLILGWPMWIFMVIVLALCNLLEWLGRKVVGR